MTIPSFASMAGVFWGVYNFLAALFIIIDVFLVVGLIYSVKRAWHFHPTYRSHEEHAGHEAGAHRTTMHDIVMKERWHGILTKFHTGTPEAARLAIIEADALVDNALKGMGLEGEHLADRLANLETEDIKSMSRIWRAHRLRNDVVHTPGFGIAPADADRAMQDYETFLREIHVID